MGRESMMVTLGDIRLDRIEGPSSLGNVPRPDFPDATPEALQPAVIDPLTGGAIMPIHAGGISCPSSARVELNPGLNDLFPGFLRSARRCSILGRPGGELSTCTRRLCAIAFPDGNRTCRISRPPAAESVAVALKGTS